ncbi:methyltransferase-like protein 24 [Gigantopelta aegis]|uniref:methyltransferase-like protein 24 n=1 Tax=Gigantopelta aegis TaxID=1735272 RepID=UPI001B88C9D8|nr:methyltransferase-like protein 24 [Gigantopelta aegis]
MLEKLWTMTRFLSDSVQKRFNLRIVFFITLLSFLSTLVYFYFIYNPIPTKPDLCRIWENDPNKSNTSLLWWQWACLIEKEIDKPYPYQCQNVKTVGNWYICWDKPYRPRKPCIVYSFGINFEFSFDDAMAERGCTVYSFDPSMGVTDHKHSSRVYFKNMGIGAKDVDDFIPNFDGYVQLTQRWKMRTLKSIRKMLGHENAVIDVLKIDIEIYEWPVVANFLQDEMFQHVRQFLVEWHIFPNEPNRAEFQQMYKSFTELEKVGMKYFYVDSGSRYHHYRYWNSQSDMCYVNTKFKLPSQ